MTPSSKILLNAGPSEAGSHRLEMVNTCPQAYAYRYVLGLDDEPASYLVRGSIAHVGLAHHYARLRERQTGGNPEKYFSVNEAMLIVSTKLGPHGPSMLPIAKVTVEEYLRAFAGEEIKILMVEEEIRARVAQRDPEARQGHLFTQRWDLVFEDAGLVYICDHKIVTQDQGERTSSRYTNSLQFLAAQYLGWMKFGARFGGVVLNVLQAAPNCRVRRKTVEPSPAMVAAVPDIIRDAEERILALADRDGWSYPKAASEKVCMSAYGPCSYFERCRWGKP